jgi:hypothetical protein
LVELDVAIQRFGFRNDRVMAFSRHLFSRPGVGPETFFVQPILLHFAIQAAQTNAAAPCG